MCIDRSQYCQGCDTLMYRRHDRCRVPGSKICRVYSYRIPTAKRLCEGCLSVADYFEKSQLEYYKAKVSVQGCRALLDSIRWTVVTKGNSMFLIPTTRYSIDELETTTELFFQTKALMAAVAMECGAKVACQTSKFRRLLQPLNRKFGGGQGITPIPAADTLFQPWMREADFVF
jgi:hypothetical protein